MKYIQKQSVCIFFGLLWLFGCGTEDGVEKVYTFPKSEWHVANRLLFECEVVDPSLSYDMVLSIYYTVAYPYQNLYIKYDLEGVETSESGLIALQLFDSKSGQPLGSGWGACRCHQLCVMSGYSFKKAATYTVRLAHFMRQDTLTGIVRVVLSIKPHARGPIRDPPVIKKAQNRKK